MIHYRSFRNSDPPSLVSLWNQSFAGSTAVQFRTSTPLEHFIFAKPYFDPAGLIVALEDGEVVGFAHAGFGPNAAQTALSHEVGVVCMIVVHPSHRRKGIGSELLRRGEGYLQSKGAQIICAGPMRPFNPFYFGLYGGADSPGFLTSDPGTELFLTRNGYRVEESCQVLHRTLSGAISTIDPRFMHLRRRFEIFFALQTGIVSWWQECVLGPLELLEFRVKERTTAQTVARATVWEMEGFTRRRNEASIGIVDLEVREDLRRQGLAKFLLTYLLLNIQEQYFTLAETQVPERNQTAIKLYQGLGFEKVDEGRIYRK